MTLHGCLDQADTHQIRGWAFDDCFPKIPVSVVVKIGDRIVRRVLANAHRPDLQLAGLAEGYCSFVLADASMLRHAAGQTLSVCFEMNALHLNGSPTIIDEVTLPEEEIQ